jgi:cyclomaltodextrin glucanotransferase
MNLSKRYFWAVGLSLLLGLLLMAPGQGCRPDPDKDCVDADKDDYGDGTDCLGPDCDDGDPDVNPGVTESCRDNKDNNCNSLVDEEDPICKNTTDFREHTIYFLFTDRFFDGTAQNNQEDQGTLDGDAAYKTFGGANGYNGGDFKGIIDHLDYIKDMGFTAIWITPVIDNPDYRYRSSDTTKNEESGYHGYWGKDFTKVDEHWESTGAALTDLIREVHRRDMKIIVDVVPNHPSPAYYFKNNKEIPQMGEVWQGDRKIHDHGPDPYDTSVDTDNWFHHYGLLTDYNNQFQNENHDLEYLGDFNHENEKVRTWLTEVYTNWLKKGMDGFRIDALKHMPRDLFLVPFAQALLAQKSDFFMFGENFHGDPTVEYGPAYYTKDKNGKPSGLSVLDFPNYFKIQDAFVSGNSFDGMNWLLDQDSYYTDATKLVTFIDNHDVKRFCGDATQLKNALNWIYTIRGIPSLYYGTESQFMKCTSDKPGRAYFGNDIADAKNSEVFKHIQKLNAIRHSLPALQKGTMERLGVEDAWNSFAFKRSYQSQIVYVAINKSSDWKNFNFSGVADGDYKDQISGYVYTVSGGTMKFGVSPNSMAVYVKQ